MNGGIAQELGNLGKILIFLPDQFLGILHFHLGEKVDHSAVMLLPEDLLQLGTPDQVFPADVFDGHITADMCFQIIHDLDLGCRATSARSPDLFRRFYRIGKVSPDHTEEQKLQVQPDQLL